MGCLTHLGRLAWALGTWTGLNGLSGAMGASTRARIAWSTACCAASHDFSSTIDTVPDMSEAAVREAGAAARGSAGASFRAAAACGRSHEWVSVCVKELAWSKLAESCQDRLHTALVDANRPAMMDNGMREDSGWGGSEGLVQHGRSLDVGGERHLRDPGPTGELIKIVAWVDR